MECIDVLDGDTVEYDHGKILMCTSELQVFWFYQKVEANYHSELNFWKMKAERDTIDGIIYLSLQNPHIYQSKRGEHHYDEVFQVHDYSCRVL